MKDVVLAQSRTLLWWDLKGAVLTGPRMFSSKVRTTESWPANWGTCLSRNQAEPGRRASDISCILCAPPPVFLSKVTMGGHTQEWQQSWRKQMAQIWSSQL